MRHMFDLTEKRPAYWGPMETSSFRSVAERESRERNRLGEGMREVQLNQGAWHPTNTDALQQLGLILLNS